MSKLKELARARAKRNNVPYATALRELRLKAANAKRKAETPAPEQVELPPPRRPLMPFFESPMSEMPPQRRPVHAALFNQPVLPPLFAEAAVTPSVAAQLPAAPSADDLDEIDEVIDRIAPKSSVFDTFNSKNDVFDKINGISEVIDRIAPKSSVFDTFNGISEVIDRIAPKSSVFDTFNGISEVIDRIAPKSSVFDTFNGKNSVFDKINGISEINEKLVGKHNAIGKALEARSQMLHTALLDAGMPLAELQKWDGELLGLKRISGGASAVLAVAQAQAAENERTGAYALDIGNTSIRVSREKGERLQDFLKENGIPFERVRSLGGEWLAKKTRTKAKYR